MKYIKTFEQLNMGDYVIFSKDYENIRKNYPYQIKSISADDGRAYFNDDKKTERNFMLSVFNDFKKISKKDAAQLILNNKFNI